MRAASETPLCPEGDFRFWSGVGVGALFLSSVGYMLGVGPLFPRAGVEGVGVLVRISACLGNAVLAVLCTAAACLSVWMVSLVRGRPAGAAMDIACRALACVCVAGLVRLVPMSPVWLKLVFDALAFLLSAAFLARAAFRVPLLDAGAGVAISAGAVAAVSAVAYAIVWAVKLVPGTPVPGF